MVQAAARYSNSKQKLQNTNNLKNEKNSESAPYTVVQSFVARLRYNKAKNEIPIVVNNTIHTTRQGFPVVLWMKMIIM